MNLLLLSILTCEHVVTFLGQWQKGLNKHTATQKQTRKGRLQLPQGTGGLWWFSLSLEEGSALLPAWARCRAHHPPSQSFWWEAGVRKQSGTCKYCPSTWLSPTPTQWQNQQPWCDTVHKQWEQGSRLSWIPPLHSIFYTDLPTPHFLWFEYKENNFALPSSRQLKEYASQMFFYYCMWKSVWPRSKEVAMAVGAQDMQRGNSTGLEATLVSHKDKQKLQCAPEQNQHHTVFFESPSLWQPQQKSQKPEEKQIKVRVKTELRSCL